MTDLTPGEKITAENADGWIEWHGGENPVGDAVVEVKCRDGSTGVDTGSFWNWSSYYAPIIAYRVVAPAPEKTPPGGEDRLQSREIMLATLTTTPAGPDYAAHGKEMEAFLQEVADGLPGIRVAHRFSASQGRARAILSKLRGEA